MPGKIQSNKENTERINNDKTTYKSKEDGTYKTQLTPEAENSYDTSSTYEYNDEVTDTEQEAEISSKTSEDSYDYDSFMKQRFSGINTYVSINSHNANHKDYPQHKLLSQEQIQKPQRVERMLSKTIIFGSKYSESEKISILKIMEPLRQKTAIHDEGRRFSFGGKQLTLTTSVEKSNNDASI